jgi:dihydrodipicolinate synthase/N-acetylneuraminate lyase
MGLHREQIPQDVQRTISDGAIIPAHPLALRPNLEIDEPHQRALTRYYIDAGAGGIAVGVHTTQFLNRKFGLYEPALRIAAETVSQWAEHPFLKVAGITGKTAQALQEARLAVSLGYHAGLLNVAAFRGANELEIIDHCKAIAAEIPLFGFYLLPAVGGIRLSADFWRQFCLIDNVVAVKVAPFNRYGTVDVVRGLIEAGAEDRITLYTGNDDHIIADLLTPFVGVRGDARVTVHFRGGLLGHWSFWTSRWSAILKQIGAATKAGSIPADLLALDSIVTDCNNAIYDAPNDFKGCVPGCHQILRRQGLMQANICLDGNETLSPGQSEEIDRVCRSYPELADDAFVRRNLQCWLSGRKAPVQMAV